MTGLIILAAGQSARLGQPKQNLVFQGKTLLQRAIEAALASVCEPVIVVLGANEEVIRPTIDSYSIQIIHNAEWREGIASSIRLGIKTLQESAVTSAILMLCDQPFVSSLLLNELIKQGANKDIVACAYNNTVGTPVLFSSAYFEELLRLTGDEGAKKLLWKHQEIVISILFPSGGVDIDTVEDYGKLSGL
jgi:molybdenum cofactor cytidylyltransferase